MASLNDGRHDFTVGLVDNNDTGELSHHSLTSEGSIGYGPAAMQRPAHTNQNGLYQQNAHQMQFANANYEENNNMDENSNDQAYEQYPDYHHQHYLAQQALHSQQQTNFHNASLNHSLHADTSSNNIGASDLPQNSFPLSSNMSVSDNNSQSSATDSGFTGVSPSLAQSVRPRTSLPASHRRMSLTPPATNYEQSSVASPFQAGSYSSWNSQQHTPSSHSSNNQESLDQCDEASLPGLRQRNRGLRGHHRNSSYDSGMNELHEQEIRRSQLESIGRLPPLPARSSYGPGTLQPLPPEGGTFVHEPRVNTDTEREAELLLYNFTQEELQRERLNLPSELADHPGLQQCHILRAGTELRRLADAFAATPARAKVRGMAEEVMFSTLTWDNFASLCMQLFSGPQGITPERIVALFTFIADVAKKEIRRGAESCIRQLMAWSLRFIFEKVCQWVQRAGGWGRVLHQGLDVVYKIAMTAAALAAAAAMGVYVVRTLRHS